VNLQQIIKVIVGFFFCDDFPEMSMIQFSWWIWVRHFWWLLIILFIWVSEVLLAWQQATVAGAVCRWFFNR
jgi:hypothetical protein